MKKELKDNPFDLSKIGMFLTKNKNEALAEYIRQYLQAHPELSINDITLCHSIIMEQPGMQLKDSFWLEKKKEFHSIAFMEGHFARSVQWQTERTDVILYIANNEGIIDFHIEYKCLDHTPLTPQEAPPSLIEAPHDDDEPQQEQEG